MKEYIKKFSTLASANNYEVADIPFTATAVGSGNTPVNVVCNQSGGTLVVSGNNIDVQFVTTQTLTLELHNSIGDDEVVITYTPGTKWSELTEDNLSNDYLYIGESLVEYEDADAESYKLKANGTDVSVNDEISSSATYTWESLGYL